MPGGESEQTDRVFDRPDHKKLKVVVKEPTASENHGFTVVRKNETEPITEEKNPIRLAGWWRRVAATVIDSVIEYVLLMVVLLVAVPKMTTRMIALSQDYFAEIQRNAAQGKLVTPEIPGELLSYSVWLTIILTALIGLYAIVFLGTWQATPGQRMLGMKVVPAEAKPGEIIPLSDPIDPAVRTVKLGWGRAVLRGLMWALLCSGGSLIMILQLFSVLMPLWHPRKQTIPDRLARTLVIMK
jgi:uncharacterized RDD family membrane protein YckC